MKDKDCLRIATMTMSGQVIAMTAMKDDLYKPRKTGVFNVEVHPLKPGSKEQRWRYNAKSKTISPHLYPGKTLSEGANKNLFIYNIMNLGMQQFLIDTTNGVVTNVLTRYLSTVSDDKTKSGWNSVMEPERPIPSMQQHWVILECLADPTQAPAASKAQVEDIAEDEALVKEKIRALMGDDYPILVKESDPSPVKAISDDDVDLDTIAAKVANNTSVAQLEKPKPAVISLFRPNGEPII